MALAGGEPVESSTGAEVAECPPPVWYHPSVPYLQLGYLDLHVADGRVFRLVAQLPDGTGYHGFYELFEPSPEEPQTPATAAGIFRARELDCLPLGVVHLVVVRAEGPNAVIELALQVGIDTVNLIAGEVYEELDGTLRIVEPDESILLQCNGAMPARCMV